MSLGFEQQRVAFAHPVACSEPPIAATIRRATERISDLEMSFGPLPDGWWRASDVISNRQAVSDLLDQVCAIYRTEDRQVAASFLVLGYFWYPMAAAVACYLLEQRVPNLAPDAIAMKLHGGVTFLSPRCWALPDDLASGHADVGTVANHDELRQRLVEQFEEHATALFATLRSVAPYGIPAMRANYIDRLASAVVWLAEMLDDDDLARREVPAMVALLNSKSRTGLVEIEHDGRSRIFLQRGGCCLTYRLPGSEMCDTCRLRPAAERETLLRAYLSSDPQTA